MAYYTYWAATGTDRDSMLDFLPLVTDPEPTPIEPLSTERIEEIREEATARILLFNKQRNGG